MRAFELEIKQAAFHAAVRAATILRHHFGKMQNRPVTRKAQFDFVTEIDREAEQCIVNHLHTVFPEHSIFAEEQGVSAGTSDYCWIIDPLDGTTNFIHGFPCFSISIALKKQEQLLFGLVLDPLRNETFHALHGQGAYLNDQPIAVSKQAQIGQALLATGFPFRQKSKLDLYLQSFAAIFQQVAGVRRAGSAALDLAYTACGRVEEFWEIGLNPWDIAAGVLLVTEAGGKVTDFLGAENYFCSGNVIAGNLTLQPQLVTICAPILGSLEIS
jgi:myo-inositol-1(or 4)-monophosphatase